ncbi:MAG: LITAF-like zinc ribbon domain-containing protein [Polyangiaceae bacterium]|nr:LITAF-like zinc ribbon domain-containing protein [Polyangiaceae bacterium]
MQPPHGYGPPPGCPPPGYYPPPGYGPSPGYGPAPPAWRCPFCGFQGPPSSRSRVKTAGWIVFGVLLLFCFPICWLGLLLTEKQTICSGCQTPVGGAF